MFLEQKEKAIKTRNEEWVGNDIIPSWVDIKTVDLDLFYTKPDIAKKCYNSLLSHMDKKLMRNGHVFIEPSAGNGAFYSLLPPAKRLGLDIMPLHPEVVKKDFLTWTPKKINKKHIFIGNPPFGYRGWLALTFMNHAAQFADYIGFILPMSFQSDGKGSPKHRVKGMKLIHSEYLSQDSFYRPDGKTVKINALWQIWKKGENIIPKKKTCKKWIDLFTVDMRKERLCGQEKMNDADYFLQRTYYNEQPLLVRCFSKVRYVCGYGMIIKKRKREITAVLNNANWDNYSNLATHNCRHISMYHIEKALIDKGFADA